MNGKHHISIESDKLKYEFDIRRNITVIQGDSATGKTTLIDMLDTYGRFGLSSGITLKSDVQCIVYRGGIDLLKAAISSYQNSIIFFDEDNAFIYSKEFASIIKETSNYYVLIARQPLYYLPYSIEEIYGIRTSGKYHYPEKIYHEFYHIYSGIEKKKIRNAVILVEDSNSGYQFFCKNKGNNECISVGGNSGFIKAIEKYDKSESVVIIADGAAFGAYVASVMAVAKRREDIMLYFPESFEWLILKSGIIEISKLSDILEEPEKYIDSCKFISWERYFTELLVKATEGDSIKRYDKGKLLPYYYEGKNAKTIISVLPDELQELIQTE